MRRVQLNKKFKGKGTLTARYERLATVLTFTKDGFCGAPNRFECGDSGSA